MSRATLEKLLALDELSADIQAEDLVSLLEQALASSDPHIRESGLVLSDRLVDRGYFSAAQLRALAERMMTSLQVGLGETGEDSAFLRAYSVLVLFEIVGYHNQKKLLSAETLRHIQRETIRYLLAEKDERVCDPVKGWIHAVPHALNVLIETAKSEELGRRDLEQIMNAVLERARGSVTQVYTGFEEELFALTVVTVLRRSLLPVADFGDWTGKLAKPPEGSASWSEHLRVPRSELVLLANLKATLRALYLQISFGDEPLPEHDAILEQVKKGLEALDTGFYNPATA